ncbi:MAG: NADH-quinone oxidoreductase subunit N [Deltaproteobacteria bacterium]|nr:NADH-quinone oxidoreductase subunit N [Deltaproteobacteria bacterium]
MLPELIVVATALTVLVADLFLSERRRVVLALLTLVGLAAALAALLAAPAGSLFGGRFSVDEVAIWFKVVFLLASFLTVCLSLDQLDGRVKVRVRGIGLRGEYYAVLLSTLVGAMFLVSARDLVTLYVSLELATIPLFALAAWKRSDAGSQEAGLKYVVMGALASAFLLYGFSLLFGLAGSTDLAAIAAAVRPSPALFLALALVTTGIGFKLTLVPFHMWAGDVYEGAPLPVIAYLSVASKAVGLAVMFQIFYRVLGHMVKDLGPLLAFLAAATMTLGNTVAIVQRSIKRFMAFSAISQAGYIVMGFLGPDAGGVPAMLFYMLAYVAANMAVFGVIIFYANATGRERIEEYRGLARTNPLLALAMMLALFSLAGIPPLSGFVGKFFLFSIASKAGFHWLVAVAAVNSTISLYYYLRIVRQMYIEPVYPEAARLPVTPTLAATVAVTTVASLVLGLVPVFYEVIHNQTIEWLAKLVG